MNLFDLTKYFLARHLCNKSEWKIVTCYPASNLNLTQSYIPAQEYAVTRMEHYFQDKAKLRLDQLTKRKSDAITEEG